MRIAVDAMGGDNAPGVEVEGAVAASREFGFSITLVGIREAIESELRNHNTAGLDIFIKHASQFITMEESPIAALKQKKDSSLRVAAKLVKEGECSALVSAGNTGAVMACSKLAFGSIKGVERPAIAAPLPTEQGVALLLDAGANVDCSVNHMIQFALMGNVYSKVVFGCHKPRVGLLNIGEEKGKGDELRKKVYPCLAALPVNFIGNVEGKMVYAGDVDVLVCDGFSGNIALKMSEGASSTILNMIKGGLEERRLSRLAYLLMRGTMRKIKKRVDYSEYGGAPFLGLKKLAIICHGSSSSKAVKNAVKVASIFEERNRNGEVMRQISEQCTTWSRKALDLPETEGK